MKPGMSVDEALAVLGSWVAAEGWVPALEAAEIATLPRLRRILNAVAERAAEEEREKICAAIESARAEFDVVPWLTKVIRALGEKGRKA